MQVGMKGTMLDGGGWRLSQCVDVGWPAGGMGMGMGRVWWVRVRVCARCARVGGGVTGNRTGVARGQREALYERAP